MKIQVKTAEHSLSIPIPTGLILSKTSAWLWLKMARKATAEYMPERINQKTEVVFETLSEDAVYALFGELMRIKKMHGSYDLVEVESASGAQVLITL